MIICVAYANFSMRQSQEGGFQTSPLQFPIVFAHFAFFAAILLIGYGSAALRGEAENSLTA
jgi:hypothetical protein